ncbi:MAG: cell surface protein SprA [bacterium]
MNYFQKLVLIIFILGLSSAIWAGLSASWSSQDPVAVSNSTTENRSDSDDDDAEEKDDNNDNSDNNDDDDDLKYQVKPISAESPEDLTKTSPVDLKQPSNVTTKIEYDPASGNYVVRSMMGDIEIVTPFTLSPDEYKQHSLQNQMNSYWKEKNAEAAENYEDKFNLADMKFSLGPAEKLFGPGGVRVKTQGSAELKFSVINNNIENYSLAERLRNTTTFDFEENIQLNVNAKVGTKMDFTMNYNTESTFSYDQSTLKLAYTGEEDEIIKSIEVGDVAMSLQSSLITGSTALFGIKTELQFGKLNLTAVISQQQSETESVSSNGGSQLLDFEVDVDNYDENRHFFLAHYFRDSYDQNMTKLPYITSGITITRIEVWVTNTKGSYDEARNIVGFMDLAESSRINNSYWTSYNISQPDNSSNSLYDEVKVLSGVRDIQTTNSTLEASYYGYGIIGGTDYEKIESARPLSSSEYTVNSELGYISLNSSLNSSEVLAVAYEYTYGGKTYQVGEFSTDGIDAPNTLILKLLKASSSDPKTPMWDLMMKNIYYLNGTQVQEDNFELNIQYKNDSSGVYVTYLTVGDIANQILLKVMNLDRLDTRQESNPDGKFDYVQNYTIYPSTGRLIFPVVEPFGDHLRSKLNNTAIADAICYDELYDSTKTVAQQYTEKNKFRIAGEYQANSGSVISLNSMNVSRGSVVVTCAGQTLTENVDYTVDYTLGTVTILNQSLLSSGNNIDVQLESTNMFSMEKKTMLGLHAEYAFTENFSLGATVMHLSETPLVVNTTYGSEPISNTIWGFNGAYRSDAPWLTKALNAIPGLNATAPSSIVVNGEFAQLIPGTNQIDNNPGYAYLDDFESSETTIDLLYTYYWYLASTPYDSDGSALFPEGAYSNNTEYGKNRALFNWYSVDNTVFNPSSSSSSSTPNHIKADLDMQSNHLTRSVKEQELFPNRDAVLGTSSYLSVLNLSFYPQERGPYNLDLNVDPSNGNLLYPSQRWGGMMRKLDTSDFETANIEYVEFWMMDPFVNDTMGTHQGGDLYINLGDVSEDILKDGKKFFENGMPTDGDTTSVTSTVWGYVPNTQSTVLAFDATLSSREYQDVGYNGLRTVDEQTFSTYSDFLTSLRASLSSSAIAAMEADAYSVLNDPASDNYHYYRGTDYDNEERSVLDRYKYYNNPEGNSPASDTSTESYTTSATTVPNAEDINQDNTLNEYEKYYQYRISIRPSDMMVGYNNIVDQIESTVTLANGESSTVKWYQFKVPISGYEKTVGSISGFSSIRFMRVFMTDFEEDIHLRLGTFELVRGDWRSYDSDLYDINYPPSSNATIEVSTVTIEENNNKEPVNYVLPPGVTRQTDPSSATIVQQDEQSMSIKVKDLAPYDARAVYKNITYDMRYYNTLQMFVHAEELIDDLVGLDDYETTIFLRMGSDHTQNYYEYEIPLKLTPAGYYSSAENETVWPYENMFNFSLDALTDVKSNRNARIQTTSGSIMDEYYEYDPDNTQNKITVIGNPSLGEIKTMMIGVRNQSGESKSVEVWIDELRLTDYDEEGGWGALANVAINLSDIGSISVSGRYETAGFGGLEESLQDRRLDDMSQFNISTQFDVGRFFPDKAGVRVPLYYSYGVDKSTPKYNPLDEDVLLDDALEILDTKEEKDSLLTLSTTKTISESFNVTNMKVDIKSKKPKFYDPANFSASYSYTKTQELDPEVDRNMTKVYTGQVSYNFSTTPRAWEPFKNYKSLDKWKIIKDFNINYDPSLIAMTINVNRTYAETQLRDLTGGMDVDVYDPYNSLLSFSKDFTWSRKFDFKYDLTKTLKFTLSTTSNSRFDETSDTPVNREFFPDEYEAWCDTVRQSLLSGGRPLDYQQIFTATWDVPLSKIPGLDFMTAKGQYSSTYNWTTGVYYDDDTSMGNTISNLATWQVDGQANFEQLYNKSAYLKKINQKYTSKTKKRTPNFTPKKFNQTVELKKGEPFKITHRLNSDKLGVIFTNAKGDIVKVKYNVVDKNSIEINSKEDISKLKVSIITKNPFVDTPAQKVADYTVRFLMLLRSFQVSYKETSSLTLPGFDYGGTFFGQTITNNVIAPGLDFSFGAPNVSYIDKAMEQGWVVTNDSVVSPAVYNYSTDFDAKVALEPIPGLKIDLNVKRVTTDQSSIQYMYEDMPTTYSGTYRMTYCALATAFWSRGTADNNYDSRAFNQFVENIDVIAARLQSQYNGARYPTNGFMADNGLAGTTYSADNGAYSTTSADVLIPAFLAAYTNTDASFQSTDLFPSLLALLPNWSVSYDGLGKIPALTKWFKSVTLNHAYQCTYNVGAYSSYSNYASNDDGLGFVKDVVTGNPIPSSPYDISSVSITESLSPLLSVDVAMVNSMTAKVEYKRQRTLTLNVTSTQILEATNNEWVIGVGYILKDFDMILKLNSNTTKKVKNDLTLRTDFAFSDVATILRKLDSTEDTQATSGNKTITVKFTADYVFSSKLNFQLFCDYQTNSPYISTSYPITTTDVGFSIKFMLTQ